MSETKRISKEDTHLIGKQVKVYLKDKYEIHEIMSSDFLRDYENEPYEEIGFTPLEQFVSAEQINDITIPKPIEQWNEDDGDCLWWSFPIEEPPYCGTPLDCDFPNYVTHFTKIVIPVEPNN